MITVIDRGRPHGFTFDDILKYHGPLAPGGVAHAYKVMERAFPALNSGMPLERRDIRIETSFAGPGARDAFEMVTRAVTGERYRVDPDVGTAFASEGYRQRYVFRLSYGDRVATAILRSGHVRDEFLALGAKKDRSKDEEIHLAWLKEEMTERLMKLDSIAVYDLIVS